MTESSDDFVEAPPQRRPRDPARAKRDIMTAAREEFVEHGLDGARVDRIAERAGANKRMLYHYVGNKEELYSQVLLQAYRDIRAGEAALHLGELAPTEAMEKLVGFTFDHFRANPWFIRLLATENIQRGAFVSELPELRALHSPLVAQIAEVLQAGESGDSSAPASIRCSSTSRLPASAISTCPISTRCRSSSGSR